MILLSLILLSNPFVGNGEIIEYELQNKKTLPANTLYGTDI